MIIIYDKSYIGRACDPNRRNTDRKNPKKKLIEIMLSENGPKADEPIVLPTPVFSDLLIAYSEQGATVSR
jgi:hypothetical protein